MDGDLQSLNSSSCGTFGGNQDIAWQFNDITTDQPKKGKRERMDGRPKRPLSAYNLFFKSEREMLVKAKRKVSFSDMGKYVSAKWKALNNENRKLFDDEAAIEKARYKEAISRWKSESELELKSLILQHQFSMSSGVDPPVHSSSENEPDLDVLGRLFVKQHTMAEQYMTQAQFKNASSFEGTRRMSMPTMTSSSHEFDNTASLPTILQGSGGRNLSMTMLTAYNQSLFESSGTPSFSFEADCCRSAASSEPFAHTYSGGDDTALDGEIAHAIMTMPISDMNPAQDENDDMYRSMISRMFEPAPFRRSSMPYLSLETEGIGEVQKSSHTRVGVRSYSMPSNGVAEFKELQEMIQMLDREDL